MTKEQFETRLQELLPHAEDAALTSFTAYAMEMDARGIEAASDFFDHLYVELSLVKRDHGSETAEALFNYGKEFTLNPFEFRGAAGLLKEGLSLEQIQEASVTDGCDPTREEYAETQAVLAEFQKELAEEAPANNPTGGAEHGMLGNYSL